MSVVVESIQKVNKKSNKILEIPVLLTLTITVNELEKMVLPVLHHNGVTN